MNKKLFTMILAMISFVAFPTIIFADLGPKPSIDININNLNTSNYLIDLFVYDSDGSGYKTKANYNGEGLTKEQINKLHELNFDGWISESTRWDQYLLFSECVGNAEHQHTFSYFGTPEKYKIVIINNDTGDIKISSLIVRKDFNSKITIDYLTMTSITNSEIIKTVIIAFTTLIATIGIELLLAYIFKIRNYRIISLTNLVTNLILQILLILFSNYYLLAFIIGETTVIISELIVYLTKLKNVSKSKIISYALIANAITIIFSLLLYKI